VKDNLLGECTKLRNATSSLKKKVAALRTNLEDIDLSIDDFNLRLDKLVASTDIYRAKLEREKGREVRQLQHELKQVRALLAEQSKEPTVSKETLRIASTMTVFESVLQHICQNAQDFRLASYSFLFPAVFERMVRCEVEDYFLDELPVSAMEVIRRGKEYVAWLREDCETHVTDPDAWEVYNDEICDWWRNDALPLLYGCRDEAWDVDMPMSYHEMMLWQNEPAERPLLLSGVFDAYEIYRKHKEDVYASSGVRDFDLRVFTNSGV